MLRTDINNKLNDLEIVYIKNLIKMRILLLLLVPFQLFCQNEMLEKDAETYEDKIAIKACACLSEKNSITNAKQAVIRCTIRATNEFHEEDIDKKYKRDFTVEGIRGLHKKVFDLLIENCDIVAFDE